MLIKEFKTAKKRREVKTDKDLSLRRDWLLSLAESSISRSEVPAPRLLSHSAEGHFKDEMSLLDTVLYTHPGWASKKREIGYYNELFKYWRLIQILTLIAESREDLLQSLNLSPPTIPSLLTESSADSLWKAKDLEMLCIALCEDVENYLVFYWDTFLKSKGTWKPSKEDSPSSSFLTLQNYIPIQRFLKYAILQHIKLCNESWQVTHTSMKPNLVRFKRTLY